MIVMDNMLMGFTAVSTQHLSISLSDIHDLTFLSQIYMIFHISFSDIHDLSHFFLRYT